ncbi:hypothetical protein [Nannocystis pusilla]|uniref:hypothetical protein n=1 Tax=Nannocystis pusilla TaxID=889268 RepID=UPI003D66F855
MSLPASAVTLARFGESPVAAKKLVDEALNDLAPVFDGMYSKVGRPSIPPESPLKATLLMALYSLRSYRMFCEPPGIRRAGLDDHAMLVEVIAFFQAFRTHGMQILIVFSTVLQRANTALPADTSIKTLRVILPRHGVRLRGMSLALLLAGEVSLRVAHLDNRAVIATDGLQVWRGLIVSARKDGAAEDENHEDRVRTHVSPRNPS